MPPLLGRISGEWLRPPRMLLIALFALALVAISALAWFGGRLIEQERVVETQRAQERQEQAADRIAADAREALAETGERLGYWLLNPPSADKLNDGVVLLIEDGNVATAPRGRLLYRPDPGEPDVDDGSPGVFAEAEEQEFQQGELAPAVETYRRLAETGSPLLRPEALTRLARVLRKTGHTAEARSVYVRLVGMAGARVAGVPADLAARLALAELSKTPDDASNLAHDLLAGRWNLTRGQFEFYWSEAAKRSSAPVTIPRGAAALSEAVAESWNDLSHNASARGERTVWTGEQPYLLVWHGTPDRRAILAAKPESIFRQLCVRQDLSCALADADGRLLLGHKASSGRATVRTPAETRLPWTLYIAAAPGVEAGMAARQRFLIFITALMAGIVIAGVYFIARAIRTEAAISRMQSDFVSAVSHEFRSPLTSMRQLSEILALGRVHSDERRQVYYDTLVRETVRLQRLVEGLLNFGRMEEGVRRYRFEELDAGQLVANVAAEFEHRIRSADRHIEIAQSEETCPISADSEALTVALRNLVDNALKYAPDCPVIWIECGIEKDRVAISIRDEGPGIPRAERKAIFRKFVRGSAAAAGNVKGSGVGLAMVRHIVAAHRGEIRVSSEAGFGSTFTILLPRGVRA